MLNGMFKKNITGKESQQQIKNSYGNEAIAEMGCNGMQRKGPFKLTEKISRHMSIYFNYKYQTDKPRNGR
jgi:hypothetical protein